jgi:hypothetical protein
MDYSGRRDQGLPQPQISRITRVVCDSLGCSCSYILKHSLLENEESADTTVQFHSMSG